MEKETRQPALVNETMDGDEATDPLLVQLDNSSGSSIDPADLCLRPTPSQQLVLGGQLLVGLRSELTMAIDKLQRMLAILDE